MTPSEPSWELYRTLLAVVREGTLSAAARKLSLTQPTVGRHIDTLEKQLRTSLFSRSPVGLEPTEAALALVPHAEVMSGAAEALRRAASGEPTKERGAVRITVSEPIGVEIIAPLLTPFRQAHPLISLEMTLTSRTEDLLQREADIAVRLFRPTQTALLARRVGVLESALFATPKYLQAHGTPRTMRDLVKHAIVGFDSDSEIRRAQGRGMPFERDQIAFRTDSYLAQRAAVEAGFGIGRCLLLTAAKKGLTRILPNEPATKFEVWLVMHEGQRMTRRVRLLFDYLSDAIPAAVKSRASRESS